MTATSALYSVLIGAYERLNEQPEIAEAFEPDVRRILLTDDPAARSDFWEIVVVERAFPDDPVRSQRLLKILGHEALDEFDRTLYVDNAVTLLTPPGELLDDWLGDHDMALPSHSYRTNVVDEFDEIVRLQYDDPTRVFDQLLAYSRHHPATLETRPFWTAMLARRSTPVVQAAMRTWAQHVLRYSRRDQLSAPLALASIPDIAVVEIDNMESKHHRWPTDMSRTVSQGKAFDPASGPLLAELRRRDRRIEELTAELDAAREEQASTARHRDELGRAGAVLRDEASDLRHQLEESRRETVQAVATGDRRVEATRASFERSRSWRLTRPLRSLSRRD